MNGIWQIIRGQLHAAPLSFWLGILVAILPAAAGILLLGVSGWFITAAAIAGLSGVFLNIFVPSAIIRALAIIRTGGRYGERVLTHDATFRFLTSLRNAVFSSFAARSDGSERTGTVLNRLTHDIETLDLIYLRLVVPVCLAGICALGLALFWASVSLEVLLSGLVFLSIWFALAWVSFSNSDRKAARRADAASEAMRLRTADLVAGRKDLAIYGGLENAAAEVLSASERLAVADQASERRTNLLTSLSSFVGQFFLATILLVCVWGVLDQTLTPALAVGLVLLALALPELFTQLLPGLSRLPQIALAAGRTVSNAKVIHDPYQARQKGKLSALREGAPVLRFQDVTFSYPGAQQSVVSNFSMEIAVGEVVAIAGRSGCGKSTVTKLAARLLLPERGQILLGERPLHSIEEKNLRRSVTVLGQRPYFFFDTIAANLRIADENASEADMWQVLELAALGERIANSPDGLQTLLGEGGLGLSGGERRRLALARAFLTRPDLFILDEMTEGLDAVTARDVLERFLEFRGETAVLMIAHKELELRAADRVIHLADQKNSKLR